HLQPNFGKDSPPHPYKHYSALRIYLALTCFDILGQPNEWMDFQSWLKSSKKTPERIKVFSAHEAKDFSERLFRIHQDYTAIYGVKSSFYRFIREVISFENREKLLKSIGVLKRIKEAVDYDDGSHTPPVAVRIEVTDEMKEKFLFAARNSFTHKGISYGDPAGGIFRTDDPDYWPGRKEPVWLSQNLHVEKSGNDTIIYQVWRWPFLLIEIIEEVLERK